MSWDISPRIILSSFLFNIIPNNLGGFSPPQSLRVITKAGNKVITALWVPFMPPYQYRHGLRWNRFLGFVGSAFDVSLGNKVIESINYRQILTIASSSNSTSIKLNSKLKPIQGVYKNEPVIVNIKRGSAGQLPSSRP